MRAPVRIKHTKFFGCVQKIFQRQQKNTKMATKRIAVRNSGVHGKGVFAEVNIAEGETLIEYKGEIITWPEALRRHPHDPSDPNHTFYFSIDEKHVSTATPPAGSTIRATPAAKQTSKMAVFSSKRYAISKRAKS